ncbi:MAG: hypothetical protein ACOX8Q_05530 [Christensenellales bacterium]|jgi:hypothetical protein
MPIPPARTQSAVMPARKIEGTIVIRDLPVVIPEKIAVEFVLKDVYIFRGDGLRGFRVRPVANISGVAGFLWVVTVF